METTEKLLMLETVTLLGRETSSALVVLLDLDQTFVAT